jgi:hypothetical protein
MASESELEKGEHFINECMLRLGAQETLTRYWYTRSSRNRI